MNGLRVTGDWMRSWAKGAAGVGAAGVRIAGVKSGSAKGFCCSMGVSTGLPTWSGVGVGSGLSMAERIVGDCTGSGLRICAGFCGTVAVIGLAASSSLGSGFGAWRASKLNGRL